jgi:hypothetical protein
MSRQDWRVSALFGRWHYSLQAALQSAAKLQSLTVNFYPPSGMSAQRHRFSLPELTLHVSASSIAQMPRSRYRSDAHGFL